ncbi:hypothetical protein A8144_12795 [Mycobacterium leprae 3125609]|nr:hypothetical protein A8144_12795 [Mycobacterium leprae 3125609]OAX70312.1 hypothetical protein A3216_12655 [Mycobacterium leprae 7935681]
MLPRSQLVSKVAVQWLSVQRRATTRCPVFGQYLCSTKHNAIREGDVGEFALEGNIIGIRSLHEEYLATDRTRISTSACDSRLGAGKYLSDWRCRNPSSTGSSVTDLRPAGISAVQDQL